jgi:hypothetical protein
MAAYEGLIVKTAKYFASVSRLSWEELLVEARAGFLDAVASFDATRGARLSSIAPIRINFALNSAKLAHVSGSCWVQGLAGLLECISKPVTNQSKPEQEMVPAWQRSCPAAAFLVYTADQQSRCMCY